MNWAEGRGIRLCVWRSIWLRARRGVPGGKGVDIENHETDGDP